MADDRIEQMLEVIKEKYEDDFFRLAIHYAAEKEGNLLLEEIKELNKESDNHPSQQQIKKFSKQLSTHLKIAVRISRNRRFSKILNRAAVVMLVLIVLFSAAMFTVNAFRVRVLNYLISIEPKYTSIQLADNSEDSNKGQPIVNWTAAYVPTYVPAGYEINSVSSTNEDKNITFINAQDDSSFIIYSEYGSANSIAVDTENASLIEKIKIHGQDGTLSVKNLIISVAWKMDNHLFTIQGTMSKDEAIKFAESVKFIK